MGHRRKPLLWARVQRSTVIRFFWGGLILVFGMAIAPQGWGQTPEPSSTPSAAGAVGLQRLIPQVDQVFTVDTSQFDRETVRLDGRRLFVIAAPNVSETPEATSPNPLADRDRVIEQRLQQIAASDFDPESLEIVYETDSASSQPILYAEYRLGDEERRDELLTVTALDAQIQGTQPENWAQDLTSLIQDALLQAWEERQPEVLRERLIVAGGLFLGAIVGGGAIALYQKKLCRRRDQLRTEAPPDVQPLPTSVDPSNPVTTSLLLQQKRAVKQQQRLNDIKIRLLQVTQLALWGTILFSILGLFPYSRWLQPVIVRWIQIPLAILGIVLITYLLTRFDEALVDRFFWVLQDSANLSPETSQRVVLRFSTFSRVVKSISTLVLCSIAFVVSLSVIGVQIGPLLAGAGIIGLAVSFAAQSLIKDMINGFLILLEDQYGVGDVIIVGDVSGLVENMNLRITQLRNAEGRLITIPNSAITVVQNLSKEWSRVDLAVNVGYHADIDRALEVINRVAQDMSRDPVWEKLILESPLLLGVDNLDHMGATVRLWIKTQPLKQWDVAREYRRRLKRAFDEADIPIGVPQQSLQVVTEENEPILPVPTPLPRQS